MDSSHRPVSSTYISTDDADATVARAKDAGAQAIVEADVGRFAVLSDPHGVAFGVIALSGGGA